MKTWILSSLGCVNYLREASIQGRISRKYGMYYVVCNIWNMFLGIVTLSATNVTMFEYTDMMKKLFEKQAEVEQVSDFWKVNYIYLNTAIITRSWLQKQLLKTKKWTSKMG